VLHDALEVGRVVERPQHPREVRIDQTTTRVIEQLSARMKANGRLPVASRQISPMTPPCRTAMQRRPGPGPLDERRDAAADALLDGLGRLGAGEDVPALFGQRPDDDRSPSWARMRNSPPSQSPRLISTRSAITSGCRPVRSAIGAAVW
jgi:hypothetical protein